MKSFIFVFVSQIIFYLLSYTFTWLIAKNFDPSTAGTYFLTFSIVTGIGIFVRWGWGQAVLRYCSQYIAIDPIKARMFLILVIKKVALRGVLALIFLVLLAKPVAIFYQNNYLVSALLGLSLFVLFKPLNEIIIQYLRIQGRVVFFALLQYILTPVGKILSLFVAFIVAGSSLPALSFGVAISELIVFVSALYFTKLFFPLITTTRTNNICNLKDYDIVSYSKYIGINLFLVFLLNKSDIIYVGQWLTSDQIALYQVSKQVSFVTVLILSGFEPIVAPAIAREIGKGKKELLIAGYQASIYYMGVLTIPVIMAIFFNGPFILSFFGDFYMDGVMPMYILVCGQVVNIMTGQAGYVLSMGGHAKLTLCNSIISLAITFSLALLLTPIYELVGLAVAVAIGIGTINILKQIEANRLEHIKWINGEQIVYLFTWASLSSCLFVLQKIFAKQLLGIIFVFFIYYLVVFYVEIIKQAKMYKLLTKFLDIKIGHD